MVQEAAVCMGCCNEHRRLNMGTSHTCEGLRAHMGPSSKTSATPQECEVRGTARLWSGREN